MLTPTMIYYSSNTQTYQHRDCPKYFVLKLEKIQSAGVAHENRLRIDYDDLEVAAHGETQLCTLKLNIFIT